MYFKKHLIHILFLRMINWVTYNLRSRSKKGATTRYISRFTEFCALWTAPNNAILIVGRITFPQRNVPCAFVAQPNKHKTFTISFARTRGSFWLEWNLPAQTILGLGFFVQTSALWGRSHQVEAEWYSEQHVDGVLKGISKRSASDILIVF